jgi:soluble lytic murein transglycosylase
MSDFKRYTFQYVSVLVLSPLFFSGARTTVSEMVVSVPELPALNFQGQQLHAMELSSGTSNDILKRDLRTDVLRAVKSSTPKKFQHRVHEIARAVINEANHHKMDPFFLLAVIKTESHFNIKARGRHGEIGLMQLMPETANWLAAQAGLTPGKFNLEDPRVNIRLGATYFASLRKEFQGYSARYIGAYNMGSGNVKRLMALNMDPAVYPTKVLNNYRGFYQAALQASAEREPATVKPSTKATKSLQTRNVINKCGTVKCRKLRLQPAMPNWAST